VFLFGTIAVSCGKKRYHKIRIINDTGYDIESIRYYYTINGESVSVKNGDTSACHVVSYEKRFRLTGKLFGVAVDSFDNPNNLLVIHESQRIQFNKRDLEKDPNYLKITSSVKGDTLFFNYVLN